MLLAAGAWWVGLALLCLPLVGWGQGVYLYGCPDDITVSTDPGKGYTLVQWQPPVTRNWTNTTANTMATNHNPGDKFDIGRTLVVYTLLDEELMVIGNCTFFIIVEDSRRLEFSDCPKDITQILQIGQSAALVMWQEPIISLEGRDVTVTSNHHLADSFNIGRTPVRYTAVNKHGHMTHCNFDVIVTSFPYNHFIQSAGSFLPGHDDRILYHSTVVDCLRACLEESSFNCLSVDINAKGKCALSRSVATDLWGILAPNTDFTHYERVMDDVTPVLIGCPQNITLPTEAGKSYATVNWQEPTVSDGEPYSLTASRLPGSRFFVGATRVVYTAVDVGQNTLSCDFFVTIEDEEAPVITQCPLSISKITSNSRNTAASWLVPITADNWGPARLTSNYQPGDWFPPGPTEVTYRAEDRAGNRAECSFVVLVQDIPDANHLSLHLVLNNRTYCNNLQDKASEEFQNCSTKVERDISGIFSDDDKFLGVEVVRFRPDEDGTVVEVNVGFSEALRPLDEQDSLNRLLAALLGRDLTGVKAVKIKHGNNGTRQDLTACAIAPCPPAMTCRDAGLRCTATCADNTGYCLNGGVCHTNDDDLVACSCRSVNNVRTYSGNRCSLTRMSITDKQLSVIALGGVWTVIMIVTLTAYVISVRYRKREKQTKVETIFSETGHQVPPDHIRADSPITSEDVGYSSRGESELSPHESEPETELRMADVPEEPATLLDKVAGVGDGMDGWDQDTSKSTSRSSSLSTCMSSSFTSALEFLDPGLPSTGSQSSSDSGTEVIIHCPGRWESTEVTPGGIAPPADARPEMTVMVDVERNPSVSSDQAHSYGGEMPDPVLESDTERGEARSPTGRVPVEPPLVSSSMHSYDGVIPDPVLESTMLPVNTASSIDGHPQMSSEGLPATVPLSLHLEHSYNGVIPDPFLEAEILSIDSPISVEDHTTAADNDQIKLSDLGRPSDTCAHWLNLPPPSIFLDGISMTEEHFV